MKRNNNGTWTLTDYEMNLVSLMFTYAARECLRLNAPALAKEFEYKGDKIYLELKRNGFYN